LKRRVKVFDYIIKEVERTNDEIRRDMPKDEGTAANSLRVDVVGSEVRSIGLARIEYLDRGTGPWKDKSKWKDLGYILDESGWAERKDINPYAAAYLIAHNGSQIFQGKKKGIELDNKIDALKQRLKQNLPTFVKTETLNKLKEGYKNG